jgi:hypothetical protein
MPGGPPSWVPQMFELGPTPSNKGQILLGTLVAIGIEAVVFLAVAQIAFANWQDVAGADAIAIVTTGYFGWIEYVKAS